MNIMIIEIDTLQGMYGLNVYETYTIVAKRNMVSIFQVDLASIYGERGVSQGFACTGYRNYESDLHFFED